MLHAEPYHPRPLNPRSPTGVAGFVLDTFGMLLLLPGLLAAPEIWTGLTDLGWACVTVGTACSVYAITVLKDRAWLTLAGLAGFIFAATPLGALVFVVAAVAIGMNLLRGRTSASRPAATQPATERGHCPNCGVESVPGARYCPRCGTRQAMDTTPQPPVMRLLRAGALVVTIAAQAVAAAVLMALLFLSGSGLLSLLSLVGTAAASTGVWWRRGTHPFQAMLLAWLVVVALIGDVALADSLGLLGA